MLAQSFQIKKKQILPKTFKMFRIMKTSRLKKFTLKKIQTKKISTGLRKNYLRTKEKFQTAIFVSLLPYFLVVVLWLASLAFGREFHVGGYLVVPTRG